MNRKNFAKEAYLSSLPNLLIESVKQDFQGHLKFSFKYFDNSQSAGQDFSNWSHDQLIRLLDKLKHFSCNTINYWKQLKVGSGKHRQSILEVYGNFPKRSEFFHPNHIPIDVSWARFRLESDMRLIGFIISEENCIKNDLYPNVFYIVFLDQNHKFYLSNKN